VECINSAKLSVFVRHAGGANPTALHGNDRHNGAAIKLCADQQPRGSITLDPSALHLLSNHLAVILGFVELLLTDGSTVDSRREDLLEIRAAAIAAASLLGKQSE
jgi:hypothetical protein